MRIAYDQSPVSTSNRTPEMPLDRQVRYATGIQHKLDEDIILGAAYTYLDAGEAKINQCNTLSVDLVGEYNTNEIHFAGANINWRF